MIEQIEWVACAERLRVSARTVEREIAAGRLACVRIRSRRLIDPVDLAAYIAASREQTCRSESAGTDTRSEYASAVVAALSGLCRPVRSVPTRSRSKLRSAALATGQGFSYNPSCVVKPSVTSLGECTDGACSRRLWVVKVSVTPC